VLTEAVIKEISANLLSAEYKRLPTDPLTATYPGIEVADAYQIQTATLAAKLERGENLIGRKIGLTSRAAQMQFGLNEPDCGFLSDRMLLFDGDPVPLSNLIQPRAEAEIAFILGKDLKGPGVNSLMVLQATLAVTASIEVIDSRIRDWAIKVADTIADNASGARVILSEASKSPEGLDLKHLGMNLSGNGQLVATATGASVMGHPARAVAWLANKLSEFSLHLRAGDIVISGALTAAIRVAKGDVVSASFGSLGTVSTRFE